MELPILYHDRDVVVVNKSSGLLVHRSLIDKNADVFAMQIVRDQIGQHVYPVHRLDRPTSGALVFALSQASARKLTTEFSEGRVTKVYKAIVRGTPPEDLTLDYPLKEELDAKSDSMARADKPAQPALTVFARLKTYEFPISVDKFPTARYSLVQAMPKTGRKHQIRRHLRHLGHPIIGDVQHGSGKHNRFFRERFGISRLWLACTEISFLHPSENRKVQIQAPLAPEFQNVVEALGWN